MTQPTTEQITVHRMNGKGIATATTRHLVDGRDRAEFEQNATALVDKLYPNNILVDIQDNNIVWVM